ncbi:MAG TPA: IS66 family transposase [Acidimicrobiales bacterium]|nr:IS66 family transposase [Acidimicrobiales bacterium]
MAEGPANLAAENEALRTDNTALRGELEALRADNESLRADNESLRDRIARLEGELGQNSENSSKPPSTDALGPRQNRAERRRAARESLRRQGKQPGAPGANLARRAPEVVVPHSPAHCERCGEDLADAEVIGEVRRQVLDIEKVKVSTTEHVALRRRCRCGQENLGSFPPEARAPVCWGPEVRALAVYLMDRQHLPLERTAELLAELLDAPVSTGWLCAVQAEAARNLEPFVAAAKQALLASPVLHADETGTQVRLEKAWVHTLTSNLVTLLFVHPRRGREALEDLGLLKHYGGTLVHDGYSSYDAFESFVHAQCGAHILRHLESVGRTDRYAAWCAELKETLLAARDASKAAAEAGRTKVATRVAAPIRLRYHAALREAFSLLPPGPPPRRRHSGGWSTYQRDAWNLATRLKSHADDVLRLLDDTAVPLTNNAAEQALRMQKLHDKISGSFRSDDGARHFATIRSYLQSAALSGENRLEVLRQLFTTGAWTPAVSRT